MTIARMWRECAQVPTLPDCMFPFFSGCISCIMFKISKHTLTSPKIIGDYCNIFLLQIIRRIPSWFMRDLYGLNTKTSSFKPSSRPQSCPVDVNTAGWFGITLQLSAGWFGITLQLSSISCGYVSLSSVTSPWNHQPANIGSGTLYLAFSRLAFGSAGQWPSGVAFRIQTSCIRALSTLPRDGDRL